MVFPIGDDNSDRISFPVVNVALIVANILVFVFLQGMGENLNFTYAFSAVPAEILSGKDIVTESREVVVNTPEGPVSVEVPGLQHTPGSVYFTLLTSIFMHGGLAHILGNMWFLWIFGDNIENDLGKVRYLIFTFSAVSSLLSATSFSIPQARELSSPASERPEPSPA